jgi:hypothetical protein
VTGYWHGGDVNIHSTEPGAVATALNNEQGYATNQTSAEIS